MTLSSNQNILYVCTSAGWSTRERQLLRDLTLIKESGLNGFLYCLKGTFLDKKANELGIKCFYHRGKLSSRLLKWHKFLNLKKIFSAEKVDLVHCYDLNSVWALSFLLRGEPLTPLLVSLNKEIKKSYRQFWYRALATRIDLFLLPATELEGGVSTHLSLPIRKMEHLRLGIRLDNNARNGILSCEQSGKILGSYISPCEESILFIRPILHALNVLNTKSSGEKCKLIFFSEENWRNTSFYSELSGMILDMGLGEFIQFQTFKKETAPFSKVDIWVALNQSEYVHDFSIAALLHGLPIVVPRTSFSRDLLGIGELLGESYKLGDARELREKCERIFSMRQQYQESLRRLSASLGKNFSLDSYKNQLFRTYQKLLDRRERLQRKRLLRL